MFPTGYDFNISRRAYWVSPVPVVVSGLRPASHEIPASLRPLTFRRGPVGSGRAVVRIQLRLVTLHHNYGWLIGLVLRRDARRGAAPIGYRKDVYHRRPAESHRHRIGHPVSVAVQVGWNPVHRQSVISQANCSSNPIHCWRAGKLLGRVVYGQGAGYIDNGQGRGGAVAGRVGRCNSDGVRAGNQCHVLDPIQPAPLHQTGACARVSVRVHKLRGDGGRRIVQRAAQGEGRAADLRVVLRPSHRDDGRVGGAAVAQCHGNVGACLVAGIIRGMHGNGVCPECQRDVKALKGAGAELSRVGVNGPPGYEAWNVARHPRRVPQIIRDRL